MSAPEHPEADLVPGAGQTRQPIAMRRTTGYHASVASRIASGLAAVAFGMSGLVAGCYISDPDHCVNNGGNAACTEEGFAFCSKCETSELRGGCVDELPKESCRPEAGGDSGSSTVGDTTATGDASGSSDDGFPSDCTSEGVDPVCDPATPYCIDGTCSPCSAAEADYCGSLDAAAPVCFATGVCTACDADTTGACEGTTAFCNEVGACVGCTSHAQCREASPDQDTPQGCNYDTGACLSGLSFWVDAMGCESGMEFGSVTQPYCAIDQALVPTNLDLDEEISVWVRSSAAPYNTGIDLVGGSDTHFVAVTGVDGRAQVTRSGDAVVQVTNSANRLFLENLELQGGTIGAEVQTSGRLWLHDVVVTGNDVGLRLDSMGRARVRNSVIHGNATIGIEALLNSRVWLNTTTVAANGSGAETPGGILLQEVPEFEILYSTIAGNSGTAEGNDLTCDVASDGTIRNSIFMSDAPGVDAICPATIIENSAVDYGGGAPDPVEAPGTMAVTYSATYFAAISSGDAHIDSQTTLDLSEVAVWRTGDPAADIDGDPRPGTPDAPDWPGIDRPQ